jgi:hypothetical protein
MEKKTVKLYVNDPMGKRCEMNMLAARKAKETLGIDIVVVKKGSDEYYSESNPPPCPSVAVNGRLIVKDGTIDSEQLQAEILKETK